MDIVMEQPLTIAFVGLVVAGVFFGGLIQTGKKFLLYAGVGSLLLTIGLVMLERATITPREAVKATLNVIARDLENNDVDAIVEHISAGRVELQDEARRRLAKVEVVDVNIKKNLKVEIVSRKGMDIAEARFNVVLRLKAKKSTRLAGYVDADRPIPQFFVVRFKLEDGHWRIREYEMSDPRAGIGT